MAGVWRMYSYWRENGHRYFSYQEIFYLYLIPHARLAHYILSHFCFLDEHQKLHQKFQEKSGKVSLAQMFFIENKNP